MADIWHNTITDIAKKLEPPRPTDSLDGKGDHRSSGTARSTAALGCNDAHRGRTANTNDVTSTFPAAFLEAPETDGLAQRHKGPPLKRLCRLQALPIWHLCS
jgi:hypothetical protein